MVKLEDIKVRDILVVDTTDLKEKYEKLEGQETAEFRVSLISEGRIRGTFKKEDYYWGGVISIDDVIEKSKKISWLNSIG